MQTCPEVWLSKSIQQKDARTRIKHYKKNQHSGAVHNQVCNESLTMSLTVPALKQQSVHFNIFFSPSHTPVCWNVKQPFYCYLLVLSFFLNDFITIYCFSSSFFSPTWTTISCANSKLSRPLATELCQGSWPRRRKATTRMAPGKVSKLKSPRDVNSGWWVSN